MPRAILRCSSARSGRTPGGCPRSAFRGHPLQRAGWKKPGRGSGMDRVGGRHHWRIHGVSTSEKLGKAWKRKRGTMAQTLVDRAAESIAESAHQASRASGAIADAIEDSVGAVRHAAKHGYDAGEELLNETTHRLKRHFALTVATAFAAGVTAGVLLMPCLRKNSARED